ncbi:MAG: hypothetical protein M3141_04030, partial [Actinomycetota bacterium]|nr:hypothetical protein [Actinomycetota bacterium]
MAPGLSVGPVDLNHTELVGRLRAPLEYWNALALFLAMAVPVVLRLVVDETRSRPARLATLAALPVYLVTLGLTFSRGGLIAALVAVAVLAGLVVLIQDAFQGQKIRVRPSLTAEIGESIFRNFI